MPLPSVNGENDTMKRSGRKSALNFNGVNAAENAYLITRLDPFHDEPYLPTGGPGTAPTVVRAFKRSITVSAPNPSTTANWSFTVATGQNGLPTLPSTSNPNDCFAFVRSFANSLDNLASLNYTKSYNYGSVNALAVYTPTGATGVGPTIYPSCPVAIVARDHPNVQFSSTVTSSGGASPTFTYTPAESVGKHISIAQFGENVYSDGPSKLISIAFEVHMTTSDLYNTGNVTVGRVPQALATTPIRVEQQGQVPIISPAVSTAVLPTNASELLLFSGAKTWPAKYGVYAVAPQASSATPDFDPNPFANHIQRTQSWQAARSNGTSTFAMAVCTSERDGKTYIASTEHFDSVIAMFEGLDPRATLVVTVSLVYETIPTDSQLLRPLARIPMEIRPHVLSAYDHAAAYIDCFCMVNENASGSFFRKVRGAFEAARNALNTPAGKAIKGALDTASGGKISQVTSAVNTLVNAAAQAKPKQKKKKNKKKVAANPGQKGMAQNPRMPMQLRNLKLD